MLIPKYWAEHTLEFTHQSPKKAMKNSKIKRFGWSNVSVALAKEHATERCEQARVKWQEQGHRINQFEGIQNYDEIPIREQIVSEYNELDCITTINSYGATCLNSQDVMILDIDNWRLGYEFRDPMHKDKAQSLFEPCPHFPPKEPYKTTNKGWITIVMMMLFIAFSLLSFFSGSGLPIFAGMCISMFFWMVLYFIVNHIEQKEKKKWLAKHGGYLGMLETILQRYLLDNQEVAFNVYKTPMGFRLIALHELMPFSDIENEKSDNDNVNVNDKKIQQVFEDLPVDSRYANLCNVQKCYRARVTGKPWRMGINDKPPKHFWHEFSIQFGEALSPDEDSMLNYRKKWIQNYNSISKNYSACEFIKKVGNDGIETHEKVAKVIALHDELSQCYKTLTLA